MNMKLPVFDGNNWNQWIIQMRVLFDAQYDLDLVNDDYGMVAADAIEAQRNTYKELRKKDQKTLFYIHQCVDVDEFEKIVDLTIRRLRGTHWYGVTTVMH